jgi:lysozyme
MRHAGCGWPNGAVDNSAILALPSSELLMLATEGRYHYDDAVRAGKRCCWRAIPRIGKRPAELGWSPARFVAETINLTDAPELPITDFIPWNELDLNGERGDGADDWSGLEQRYALIGGWALSVVQSLKQWSPETRIHWPAWTPDHDALGHIGAWGPAADLCDVVDFHAYDTLENIERQYGEYRGAFPGKPLMLTEWHGKGDLQEERRILTWLAETMQADPLFEAAHFFIWRWHNAPGWWSDAYDIEHNPDRHALFMEPPTVAEPEEPTMPLPRGIDVASYQGYPDWQAVAADGYDFAITKITEDDGYTNPTFAHNWAGIKAAGMVRGAYHFARPEGTDAVREADYFVGLVEQHGIETGDILALDLEAGAGDLGPWVLAFCHRVEERCGFSPIIYTGRWFSEPHNLGAYPEIGNYALWLASYQQEMPAPPAPWQAVSIWQHSSSGQVPGIGGDVDLNVFNGDLERLPLLGKPAATEPEEPSNEYAVGPGILQAMQDHGDQPATDEVYHGSQYSEAWGASGAHYVYLAATNMTHRYDPAA